MKYQIRINNPITSILPRFCATLDATRADFERLSNHSKTLAIVGEGGLYIVGREKKMFSSSRLEHKGWGEGDHGIG